MADHLLANKLNGKIVNNLVSFSHNLQMKCVCCSMTLMIGSERVNGTQVRIQTFQKGGGGGAKSPLEYSPILTLC